MSEFKVKVDKVRNSAGDQNDIVKQMKRLEDEVLHIQNNLSFEIAQKQQIRQRLKNARSTMSSQAGKLSDASKALNKIASAYETTEAGLAGKSVAGAVLEPLTNLPDIQDLISQGVTTGTSTGITIGIAGPIPIVIKPGMLISAIKDTVYQEIKEKVLTASDKTEFEREDQIEWYSENKEKLKDSKIKPFKVLGKKWGDTTSVWSSEQIIGDKDGTHTSSSIDVLKQSYHAEVYGGLYYTDPETGKKRLRLAAGADFGYTVSALTMSQVLQIGDKYLNAYIKTEETVGKVDANVSGVLGLHDAEGNFNPTAHGKLSLEALAVEMSANGGINVLGADIGVTGRVNVGVGAHAEFGYKDGVFSADIGASLGLGGSIKLEVNVGGMVDTVASTANAAWTALTGLFK